MVASFSLSTGSTSGGCVEISISGARCEVTSTVDRDDYCELGPDIARSERDAKRLMWSEKGIECSKTRFDTVHRVTR